MSTRHPPGLTTRVLAVAAVIAMWPGIGWSQPAGQAGGGRALLPSTRPLPRLPADPREPGMFGRLIFVADPDTPLGTAVQGEGGFGAAVPIYRFWGGHDEHGVLAVGAGAFARFGLDRGFGDVISGDFVFTPRFVARSDRYWYRIGFLHYSAHVGDGVDREDVEQLGLLDFRYERNALDAAVGFEIVGALQLYAGGLFNFVGNPKTDQPGAFAGVDARGPTLFGLPSFVAGHVAIDPERNWNTDISTQAGVRIGREEGTVLRLAVEAFRGGSPQRQFFFNRTTYVGLALYYDF